LTTIAYKQGILATDTQLTWGNERHYTSKVKTLPTGIIIACSGIAASERRAHEIFSDANWRSLDLSEKAKSFSAMLFINCELYLLTGNYIPIPITDRFFAIGTGAPYALAAMSLGCSAHDAIKLAADFDVNTNKVIEEYEIIKQR
jgi:ATP-dependent protease HslVU (ClpYQ) peptidase subunit